MPDGSAYTTIIQSHPRVSPTPGCIIAAAGAKLIDLWNAHEAADVAGDSEAMTAIVEEMNQVEEAILVSHPASLGDAAILLGIAANEIANGQAFDDAGCMIERGETAVRRAARFLAESARVPASSFPWDIYLSRHRPRHLAFTCTDEQEAAPLIADAELLALSEQHEAAFRDLNATADVDDDAVSEAAAAALWTVEDQIEALPARTCAGLMVKAKVLARIYAVSEEPMSDEALFHQAFEPGMVKLGADQRLVGNIMRDMVAMAGEAP